MPLYLDDSQSPKVFDAEWYLENYPDVAAAGIDPYEHYERFGKIENRFPHHMVSVTLEERAWGGFSKLAIEDLNSLSCAKTSSGHELDYANWALGRWYASKSDWELARAHLRSLYDIRAQDGAFLPKGILLIEVLLRQGKLSEALEILASLQAIHPNSTEIALAAANVNLYSQPKTQESDDQWLKLLNTVYTCNGMSKIIKLDKNKAISLDNLSGPSNLYKIKRGPKVSVIVTTFNSAKFVTTTLRCLLEQTWKNIEIVVIDDCSEDNTLEIVSAIAAKDCRIVVIPKMRNTGAYAARNQALEHVTGDFITNHDSDDWSHPERIERLANALINDSDLIGVMAHWVRTDDSMHFQRWRMENGIIHASVSTLMFRRAILNKVGGWDNVRVGADTELLQRIKRIFGYQSVLEILPGIPLTFARQHPNSLTGVSATHLRTQFSGLRQIYNELALRWHQRAKEGALFISPKSATRTFQVPVSMINSDLNPRKYDCIIMADLGDDPDAGNSLTSFIETIINQGLTVGLFHWPLYTRKPLSKIKNFFLDKVLVGICDILLPTDSASTKYLFIVNSELLKFFPDQIPKVAFRTAEILDEDKVIYDGHMSCAPNSSDRALLLGSTYFSDAWYLCANPDVRASGIEPIDHYIHYGSSEGREPGPDFNSIRYAGYFGGAEAFRVPALLHYLRVGEKLGYDPSHPIFLGQAHLLNRPNILVCAHTSAGHLFGAERSLIDVLDAYKQILFNVIVTIPSINNQAYIEELAQRAEQIMIISAPQWSHASPTCSITQARFSQVIQEHSITAVHVNTIMLREPILAAKAAGVPSFIHARESLEFDSDLCQSIGLSAPKILQEVKEIADKLIANSAFTSKLYSIPNSTYILPNSIIGEHYDMPNEIDDHIISIALISSNIPKKGLADFIEIANQLLITTPAARLIIIGPENQHTEEIIQKQILGLVPNNVLIKGYADTPAEAIGLANIVVNLSHFQETFGRTILEAMAARRPVLAYDHGAMSELIIHGHNGFLVPFRDVACASKLLAWLCDNPETIHAMGNEGRRIAVDKYSPDKMADRLANIYKTVF